MILVTVIIFGGCNTHASDNKITHKTISIIKQDTSKIQNKTNTDNYSFKKKDLIGKWENEK